MTKIYRGMLDNNNIVTLATVEEGNINQSLAIRSEDPVHKCVTFLVGFTFMDYGTPIALYEVCEANGVITHFYCEFGDNSKPLQPIEVDDVNKWFADKVTEMSIMGQ